MSKPYDPQNQASADGSFKREATAFRQSTNLKLEPGRYILYATLGCPWAGRALAARSIKKLENVVDLSLLNVTMGPEGWYWNKTDERSPRSDPEDPIQGFSTLRQVYRSTDPEYSGKFSVPVLFDKVDKKVVCNESADLLRIFNDWGNDNGSPDLYPAELHQEIEATNDWTYSLINNGMYAAGFATVQAEYSKHAPGVFEGFQRADDILARKQFLCGPGDGVLTEADIRLFVSCIRFDVGYSWVFRLNKKRLIDYPNLHAWMVRLYRRPEIGQWADLEQLRTGVAVLGRKSNDKELIVPFGPFEEDIIGAK